MKCPKCSTLESKVKKTIIQVEELGFNFGELKQRRRECLSCGRPFYTYEVHEDLFRRLQEALGRAQPAKSVKESRSSQPQAPPDRRELKVAPSRGSLEFRRSLDDE